MSQDVWVAAAGSTVLQRSHPKEMELAPGQLDCQHQFTSYSKQQQLQISQGLLRIFSISQFRADNHQWWERDAQGGLEPTPDLLLAKA